MQSLEREVRSAINSIHDELVATGTEGPAPQQPATTSGKAPDHQGNRMNVGVSYQMQHPD
jgi:hypothetical protein